MHYGRLVRNGSPETVKKRFGENRKKHPLYNTYKKMISRCYSEKSADYKNYGGRGVKVCDEWRGLDGFTRFIEDMGEKPSGTSIDRIYNNGDYTPFNCRWATSTQQNINRRQQKNNTSGVEGVYFRKDSGKWRAMIGFNNKLVRLGTFKTKEEATEAREKAESRYFSLNGVVS